MWTKPEYSDMRVHLQQIIVSQIESKKAPLVGAFFMPAEKLST